MTDRESVLAALELVERYNPDFVCFPEIVLQERGGQSLDTAREIVVSRMELAESIPGPSTDTVGDLAAHIGCYVLLPTIERDGDRHYNSVVFVDPDGGVMGVYQKLRPPQTELDPSIVPGKDITVWETEHGRVGASVCFDLMYQRWA